MVSLLIGPTVHVRAIDDGDDGDDADDTGGALGGWVAARLLQERYTVVPTPSDAQWTIAVERAPEGWRLEVRGDGTLRETIAPAEEGIARLELLHRMVEALEQVAPAPVSSSEPPLFRVRLRVEEPTVAGPGGALETRLVTTVLEQGMALSGDDRPADANLCVSRVEGEAVRIALGEADETCAAILVGSPSIGLAEIDRGISAVLPRQTVEHLPPDPDEPASEPSDEPRDEPPTVLVRGARPSTSPAPGPPDKARRHGHWARPATVLRVGVSGGLVGRVRPVDGAIGAHARLGREPGVGLRVEVEVWPSLHDALRVVDIAPSAGLDGRLVSTELLALDLGAVVGPVIHHYAINDGPRGNRVDWNLTVPLTLSFRIVAGLEGSVGLRLGRSARARTHVINTDEVWARGAWRVGAMLGFAHQWRLR
jgi:hypothetical protein